MATPSVYITPGTGPLFTKESAATLKAQVLAAVKSPELKRMIQKGAFDALFARLAEENIRVSIGDLSRLLGASLETVDAKLHNPEISATLIGASYIDVAVDMIKAGCTSDQLSKAMLDMEAYVDHLFSGPIAGSDKGGCGFGSKGISKQMIRAWLNAKIDKQYDAGQIKYDGATDSTSIVLKYKLGLDDLRELLKKADLKITDEAFDYLFGNQDGDYSLEKDGLSLESFVSKIRKEVLPFANMISPDDGVYRMFKMFEVTKFILVPKEDMGKYMKDAFVLKLTDEVNRLPEIPGTSKGEVIKKIKEFCEKGEIFNLRQYMVSIYKKVYPNEDDMKAALDGSVLKSLLSQHLLNASDQFPTLDSSKNANMMFALAGYALFYGEVGSLRSMFLKNDGTEDQFNDLIIDFNENIGSIKVDSDKALYRKAMIMTLAGLGVNGEDGFPRYGEITAPYSIPTYENINGQLKWLAGDWKKVVAMVKKIDETIVTPGGEKKKTPVYPGSKK